MNRCSKLVILTLIALMLISAVNPTFVYASSQPYPIPYLIDLGLDVGGNGTFDYPYESRFFPENEEQRRRKGIAQFKLTLSNGESLPSPDDDSPDILNTWEKIDAQVGDTFTIQNLSRKGVGDPISYTNFSVIRPDGTITDYRIQNTTGGEVDPNDINRALENNVLDEPGEWTFSCYVDTPSVDETRSVTSQNGNYFYPGRGLGSRYENTYFKVYFSAVKVNVRERPLPKVDFDIYHKGSNVTDDSSNPIQLDALPYTVDLSISQEEGEITKYEWFYWDVVEGWKLFSSVRNPSLAIDNADRMNVFKLPIKLEGTDAQGLVASKTHHVYANIKDKEPPVDPPEPPPPPKPEKPEVDDPTADIWIEVTNDHPSIPNNVIYEGEHLHFKSRAYGFYQPRSYTKYYIQGAEFSDEARGEVDETYLFRVPYKDGQASQTVYFDNYEYDEQTNTYVRFRDKVRDTVHFIVKKIEPPKITFDSDIIFGGFNLYHVGDVVRLFTKVEDINEPSEEHPKGFDFTTQWEIVQDSTGTIIDSGIGVINTEHFEFTKGKYKADEYYTYRVTATNTFNTNRFSTQELRFFIENQYPEVELNITDEDGQAPTFCKEEFAVHIKATDYDGYIKDMKIEIVDDHGNVQFLGENIIKPLDGEDYECNVDYVCDSATTIDFKVTVTDDCGGSTAQRIRCQIVKPSVYARINIQDEQNIKKKVNRYIGLDLVNSYENAPFGIDHSSNALYYRLNGGDWVDISNLQNIDNSEIRIHYPNFPNKDVMHFYMKKHGTVDFKAKVFDNRGFESEEVIKSLVIQKDQPPISKLNIESTQHRITENDVANHADQSNAIQHENINKAYIKVSDTSSSMDGDNLLYKTFWIKYDKANDGLGNDTEYVAVIYEDKDNGQQGEVVVDLATTSIVYVTDLNNADITFLTDTNGLGNYYISQTIQEKIEQLPPQSSPLYDELINKGLRAEKDYSNVYIDNMKPSLSFEIGEDKAINLIFHFDRYITIEERNKINQLVQNLEKRGLKVNLRIYENKY